MALGQEFDAFATTIKEDVARLGDVSALFREVNLGATAIGTGINADPRSPWTSWHACPPSRWCWPPT